jgi:hypothetical protein
VRELPAQLWPGILETATQGSQQRQPVARQLCTQAR